MLLWASDSGEEGQVWRKGAWDMFFSCICRGGAIGSSLLSYYISTSRWGTVIGCCLRDSGVGKSVLKYYLKGFDSSEKLLVLLLQDWENLSKVYWNMLQSLARRIVQLTQLLIF